MGDDLTCHIQALSEDKVRMASKMNSFAAQVVSSSVWCEKIVILS